MGRRGRHRMGGNREERDRRRREAAARKAAVAALTPQDRIRRLDRLYGPGRGATAERLRLHEAIARRRAS